MTFRVGSEKGTGRGKASQAAGRARRKVPKFEEWQGCLGPKSAFVQLAKESGETAMGRVHHLASGTWAGFQPPSPLPGTLVQGTTCPVICSGA